MKQSKLLFQNILKIVNANLIILGIEAVMTLMLPKFLPIKQYGYWQFYLFVCSYVGFFHGGWLDGMFLQIAGTDYEKLPKAMLGSQFVWFLLIETGLAILGTTIIIFSQLNQIKKLILISMLITLILTNSKQFIGFILQATHRIKAYAFIMRTDKIGLFGLSVIYLLSGGRSFYWLIILDLVAKVIIVVIAVYFIRDIVFGKKVSRLQVFPEIKLNLKIGSKILLGNLASILIIGIVRFGIEQTWNIEVFAKIALILNLSSALVFFINSIGVVLLPIIRRLKLNQQIRLFQYIRQLLVPITFIALIGFIPLTWVINYGLKEYGSIIEYLPLLFPMFIYESRYTLLISTYLKILRKEKSFMVINSATMFLSFFITLLNSFVLKNLALAIFSILVLLIFRCIVAELYLTRILKISNEKIIIGELVLTLIFVWSFRYYSLTIAMSWYLIGLIVYLFIQKDLLQKSFKELVIFLK